MRGLLQALWNWIILLVLWPIWWPLFALVYMPAVIRAPYMTRNDCRRKHFAKHAFSLAVVALGWRDPK